MHMLSIPWFVLLVTSVCLSRHISSVYVHARYSMMNMLAEDGGLHDICSNMSTEINS